jgi:uncharacterized protein
LFSRRAAAEAQHKPLAQRRSQQLSAALIDHSRRIAQQSGLPLIWVDDTQQQGEGFGPRFVHALAQVFAQGYQRVIAIGNDCPELQAQDLTQAAAQLEAHGLVIGPALDGGAYLIGLDRAAFDPAALVGLAWESAALARDLHTYAQARGQACHWLTTKTDLDHQLGLQQWLQRAARQHRLARQLRALLTKDWQVSLPHLTLVGPAAMHRHIPRGPPLR